GCSNLGPKYWSERGDSNSRPLAPEARGLRRSLIFQRTAVCSQELLVTGPKLARSKCDRPHRNPKNIGLLEPSTSPSRHPPPLDSPRKSAAETQAGICARFLP